MARIAYLGPEGTFTEAALLKMAAAGVVPRGGEITPHPTETTPSAIEAVRSGAADFACVPIENSIEGSVLPTLDSLATGSPLQIYAELTLDVAFSIVVQPGMTAAQVRSVAAFPVAAAQVRRWLAAELPEAEVVPTNSNASTPDCGKAALPCGLRSSTCATSRENGAFSEDYATSRSISEGSCA